MEPIRVGLMADPAAPTEIARTLADLTPLDGCRAWDITIIEYWDLPITKGPLPP